MSSTEAPTEPGRGLRNPGRALSLAFFLLFLVRNARRLHHPIREAADFAANSMLIDRAEHFDQLTGNYSRVHFHHPGPAFFYVGALGQGIFHQLLHVVPADFNGQLIAFFALNAWLAGLVVNVLRRHIDSTAACVASVSVVMLWLVHHVALAVPWPPYLYVLPFLLLAVSAPSVVLGELRSMPAYTIAAGFLVHGHASFLMFVSVTTAAALVCWLVVNRGRRGDQIAAARGPLRLSAGIAFLFLLPMVLDLILHWPGQWLLYWRYSRQASSNPVSGVLTYTGHFWTGTALGWLGFAVALLVAVVVALRLPRTQGRYLLGLAVSIGFLVCLVMFYAYRGVDDLTQLYTGDFSTALPGLLLGTTAMLVVEQVARRLVTAWPAVRVRVLGAVFAVAAGVLVLVGSGMAAQEAVYPGVDADLVQLQAMVAPGQPVILDQPSAGATWPKVFAVLEEAHRRGLPICTAQVKWQFIAAPAVDCTAKEVATGKHIMAVYVGPTVKKLTTVTWSGGRLKYTVE